MCRFVRSVVVACLDLMAGVVNIRFDLDRRLPDGKLARRIVVVIDLSKLAFTLADKLDSRIVVERDLGRQASVLGIHRQHSECQLVARFQGHHLQQAALVQLLR